jgi:hypothetical protein
MLRVHHHLRGHYRIFRHRRLDRHEHRTREVHPSPTPSHHQIRQNCVLILIRNNHRSTLFNAVISLSQPLPLMQYIIHSSTAVAMPRVPQRILMSRPYRRNCHLANLRLHSQVRGTLPSFLRHVTTLSFSLLRAVDPSLPTATQGTLYRMPLRLRLPSSRFTSPNPRTSLQPL